MPKPLIYRPGDRVQLVGTVEPHHDAGWVRLNLGGHALLVPLDALDRADVRDDSYRTLTDAEADLARLAAEQDAHAASLEAPAAEPA